jgi:hypothetical protein
MFAVAGLLRARGSWGACRVWEAATRVAAGALLQPGEALIATLGLLPAAARACQCGTV